MPDRRDTLRDDSVPIGPQFGLLAATATDFAELLPVTLPDFDPTLQWGPCRWQARDDHSMPRRGDRCLVIFDNRNNPVIVMWWPYVT